MFWGFYVFFNERLRYSMNGKTNNWTVLIYFYLYGKVLMCVIQRIHIYWSKAEKYVEERLPKGLYKIGKKGLIPHKQGHSCLWTMNGLPVDGAELQNQA